MKTTDEEVDLFDVLLGFFRKFLLDPKLLQGIEEELENSLLGSEVHEHRRSHDDDQAQGKSYLQDRRQLEFDEGKEDPDQHEEGDGQVVQAAIDHHGSHAFVNGKVVLQHINARRVASPPAQGSDGIDALSGDLHFEGFPEGNPLAQGFEENFPSPGISQVKYEGYEHDVGEIEPDSLEVPQKLAGVHFEDEIDEKAKSTEEEELV